MSKKSSKGKYPPEFLCPRCKTKCVCRNPDQKKMAFLEYECPNPDCPGAQKHGKGYYAPWLLSNIFHL